MFNKLRGLGLVLLVLVWITPAQAVIPWTVVDTYTETVKTFSSKALPGNVTTQTETSTEQYKDSSGNTVEKTTTRTYEITADIVESVVQKRQVFKMEKVNKKGILKQKTHKGSTYRETVRESSGETRTLVGTQVAERVIEYAKKEEPTKVVSADKLTNVAVNQDFGANAQFLGTRTEMISNESSYYVGLDEFADNLNGIVNQDAALARGWTGKGSTIAIMDSGIDLDHQEFDSEGKIVYTKDWTGTGMQDNVGHGSHVASIAAGELDGSGITGIAPDANLVVYKITDNWNSSTTLAKKSIKDARDQGLDVTVFSLSSNTNYSGDYRESVTYQGNGIYTSDHHYYGGENYYNLENPASWFNNKLEGTESVLVVSAGNLGEGYVSNPATFATATNADGSLVLDGRMLIAGNWNVSTQTVEGQTSGHMCKSWDGAQCNDLYRTKDFYILAPGMSIKGANIDGGYREFSGSSQAAPVVAGAVAVIHQMWPYMKGDQIVKVLTTTADKTITGYNEDTHGSGLLDLDKATQPLGDVGISYTGRTGTTVPLSGGIAIAGVDEGALASLSSVSVVDSIGRDYAINLKPAATTMNSMIPIYQLDHSVGSSWSSKFVGGGMEARGMYFGTYETPGTMDRESFTNVTLGFDDTMFMKRDPVTGRVMNPSNWQSKFTFTQSYGSPFMAFSGMWGQTNSSQTFEFSQMYKPNNWYGQLGVMYTTTQFDQGLVTKVDPITSMYGMAGWSNDNWNLYVGFKPTVISGNVHLNIPTSVDASGNMHYTSAKASLKGDVVKYVGAQYNLVNHKDKFNNEHSVRMNGVVDEFGDSRVGAYWSMEF
jgi:subtilisin family serine protease